MALFIKSGGNRFDLPVIKSCCVSLSANDFIMKISVNCHVTDVKGKFQFPTALSAQQPPAQEHKRWAALAETSSLLNALRPQTVFLLCPVGRNFAYKEKKGNKHGIQQR